MERDYGYSVSGLGPKQSVDEVARGHRAMHRSGRAPRSIRTARRAALAVLNAVAPGFTDRLVQRYGRRRVARARRAVATEPW